MNVGNLECISIPEDVAVAVISCMYRFQYQPYLVIRMYRFQYQPYLVIHMYRLQYQPYLVIRMYRFQYQPYLVIRMYRFQYQPYAQASGTVSSRRQKLGTAASQSPQDPQLKSISAGPAAQVNLRRTRSSSQSPQDPQLKSISAGPAAQVSLRRTRSYLAFPQTCQPPEAASHSCNLPQPLKQQTFSGIDSFLSHLFTPSRQWTTANRFPP